MNLLSGLRVSGRSWRVWGGTGRYSGSVREVTVIKYNTYTNEIPSTRLSSLHRSADKYVGF